jgi:hypothetical protein
MQVSITFCGGCNPNIDRGRLAAMLKERLEPLGISVSYNKSDADFVVYLSGCAVSCVSRKVPENQDCVRIAGCSVNSLAAAEEDLCRLAVEKVLEYYDKPQRTT